MKFSKVKCKILYLGRKKPRQHYRLETNQLKSSFTGKDLKVLAGTKWNIRQNCTLAAEEGQQHLRLH